MSSQQRVAEMLRNLRVARGLTQEDLARAAGTTQRRISMIESGREGASLEALERIAGALGATVSVSLIDTSFRKRN